MNCRVYPYEPCSNVADSAARKLAPDQTSWKPSDALNCELILYIKDEKTVVLESLQVIEKNKKTILGTTHIYYLLIKSREQNQTQIIRH